MHTIYKTLRSNSYSVPCELCSIGGLCIPMLLNNSLSNVLERQKSYLKDEIVVKSKTPFKKFYIVHSGAKMFVI